MYYGICANRLLLGLKFLNFYLPVIAHFYAQRTKSSSSSSSIGCGAGNHKVSPCMTIISKCGNLLFLHCSFTIPKQSLYIIKVWSTWSTRSPFANGRNVQSISSSRFFLWHSEDVTKKFQLAVPNQMNQRHSVSHGIDGGVQNMVNALYIQHDSEPSKSIVKGQSSNC